MEGTDTISLKFYSQIGKLLLNGRSFHEFLRKEVRKPATQWQHLKTSLQHGIQWF